MSNDHDASTPQFWDTRFSKAQTPWDAGAVPAELEAYLLEPRAGYERVLVPGCGSAYEVGACSRAGYQVTAIDFSPKAVAAARRTLGALGGSVQLGDFFQTDFGATPFDLIYERAFLCSLPRRLWPDYAARISELLRPGGLLIGFFFFDTKESGPPFGLAPGQLYDLLGDRFVLEADAPAMHSVPVFTGKERWQRWRGVE